MKFKMITTALVLGASLTAAAEFRTVQLAYEVALNELRLPASINGTIAFKSCNDCDVMTKRVNAETRYLVNDEAMPLPRFRERLARVTDRADETVTVLHHLENDVVTKVAIFLR